LLEIDHEAQYATFKTESTIFGAADASLVNRILVQALDGYQIKQTNV